MTKSGLFQFLHDTGVIPVACVEDAANAVPLAEAVLAGGIGVLEITFRTEAAEEAIRQIRAGCPKMLVGAGTVLHPQTAEKAVQAGAAFIVSAGLNPETVSWCTARDIPVLPGVCTPSEIEQGLALGLDTFKFFPAEAAGGAAMLKSLSGPFPGVRFLATGGIRAENIAQYARCRNVLAAAGSWMVGGELQAKGRWDEITRLCAEALLAVQGLEFAHLGINNGTLEEAEQLARMFEAFGMRANPGPLSIFMNREIELMNRPFYGSKGHIGFRCTDPARTAKYLEKYGFTVNTESIQYDADGSVRLCYFQEEAAGFAIHLVK